MTEGEHLQRKAIAFSMHRHCNSHSALRLRHPRERGRRKAKCRADRRDPLKRDRRRRNAGGFRERLKRHDRTHAKIASDPGAGGRTDISGRRHSTERGDRNEAASSSHRVVDAGSQSESSSGAAANAAVESGENQRGHAEPHHRQQRQGQDPELSVWHAERNPHEGDTDDRRADGHGQARPYAIRQTPGGFRQDPNGERKREEQQARLPLRHVPRGNDGYRKEEDQCIEGDEKQPACRDLLRRTREEKSPIFTSGAFTRRSHQMKIAKISAPPPRESQGKQVWAAGRPRRRQAPGERAECDGHQDGAHQIEPLTVAPGIAGDTPEQYDERADRDIQRKNRSPCPT